MKMIIKGMNTSLTRFSVLSRYGLLALVTILFAGTGLAVETNEVAVPQIVLEKEHEEATAANQGFARSEDWKFSVGAYLWGSSIKGTTRAGDDIDVGFSDILDDLEMAAMGIVEVRKGKWGLVSDIIYIRMAQDLNETPVSKEELTLDTWIIQSAATYNLVSQENYTLDVLAGARYLYIKADVDVDIGPVTLGGDISEGIWNGIVGVRGYINLPKQWFSSYHADVGTGDTKLTYQLLGNIGYKFEKTAVVAGYRYLAWEFDQDDDLGGILDEFILQGPYVGVRYVF
jgi:hypothetical protein